MEPRSPSSPQKMLSGRSIGSPAMGGAETKSFRFSKSTDEHMRRPSFSETLADALKRKGAVEPGIKRGGGWLYKKTTTGAWAKRFYVIHGHYLTYFAKEVSPNFDELPTPAGSLDMWHVDSVSLDSNVLSLRLSPEAAEARREEVGSALLREGKKLVTSLNVPGAALAKTAWRQAETFRRGVSAPTLVLRAASEHEAAAWLRAMRESPLMGSMVGTSPQQAVDDHRIVKEVRILLPPSKEINYGDSLLDTSILVRQLPTKGASISVVVNFNGADRQGSAPFEPAVGEMSGSLVIALPGTNDVCLVDWERKMQTKAHFALLAAASGVFVFIMAILVTRALRISLALGVAACFAAMAHLTVASREANDIVLLRAFVHVGALPTGSGAGPGTGKPKERKVAEITKAVGMSPDLNVTPEEAGAIAELRRRLQDLYAAPEDADAFVRKNTKFLEAWGADLGNVKNLAKRKAVVDKHVMLHDYRTVRFLRARKGNVDKAETMARECVTWRIALGSDDILRDFAIPRWLLDYAGSPVFTELSGLGDGEARFERFWIRDTEGHLAIFFRVGHTSTRRIFRKAHSSPEFLIKCVIWATEIARLDLDRMHEMTKGKNDSTVTAIVDLEGFALSNQIPLTSLIGIAQRFFPIFSTSYPELLNRVIVVRAPWLFGNVWNAVSPFIPEEVLDKIQIHSGDVNLKKHIMPYVKLESFPAYLGGHLVDPDDDERCTYRFGSSGPELVDKGESLLAGLEPTAEKKKSGS